MDHPVKCHAISKQSGERCRRWATPGHKVCSSHGSKSPQAIRSAQERLRQLLDPALDALAVALAGDDVAQALKAARMVLDRTGHAARKDVRVEDVTPPYTVHLYIPDNGRSRRDVDVEAVEAPETDEVVL